jgi:23S rRNA (uracil1939-C5)-methyltransferase
MEEIALQIESYNDRGEGVAYFERDGRRCKAVVFNVVPGDLVQASVNQRKKRGQYKARWLSLLKKSPHRIEPPCSHTPLCGGCPLQAMDYAFQLKLKAEIVKKEFSDLIKKSGVEIFSIISSDYPWAYRNKMEFSFSENGAKTKFLGLMIVGASRFVFNLEKCFLAPSWVSTLLNDIRSWWEKSSLQAYSFTKDTGHLRYLTIREGKNSKEKMVILTVSGSPLFTLSEEEIASFVQTVRSSVKDDDHLSIYLRTQKIEKKKATVFIESHLFGLSHIQERFNLKEKNLFFNISPSSFFQPNTSQAEKLYTRALELSSLKNPNVTIFDLYCGTGTLGMAFSPYVKKVIGIELSSASVKDARENIKLNKIDNFDIFEGDVGKILTALLSKKDFTYPELVIVDPPRSGLDPLALSQLKLLKPKKILYISCNPKTQAANISVLLSFGYKLKILQPVDQFPHTIHIENIGLLELS